MSRTVELPSSGRLIVATDLQGNFADYERIEAIYKAADAEPNGAVLVLTGDLVHGPEIPKQHWPDYLGSYYRADSVSLIESARRLAGEHEGRVFYLLGNHEHAHVGGPVVSKFFGNEALRLERLLGPARADEFKRWLRTWPFVAVARDTGLLMLHGAPNASIQTPDELEDVELEPPDGEIGAVDELLAELLWARTASTIRARAFLSAFDPRLRVAIYGHDVAREGFAIDREPLLCISSSFGCHDGDKLYLDWDLRRPITSAHHVAAEGLKPLYPDAEPVYRGRSELPASSPAAGVELP